MSITKFALTLTGIAFIATLLTSCSETTEQKLQAINEKKTICETSGQEVYITSDGNPYCVKNKVEYCIDKYIDSIDEKYNNPDTVSNLSDSNFSEAVKTCNEVFGKK